MRKVLFIFLFAHLASSNGIAQVEDIPYGCDRLPYKQRMRIAVSEFKYSARGSAYKAGAGMTNMLSNALVETGCFRVLERAQLNDITKEQGMNQSGAFNQSTAAGVGNLTGAQLMVMGDITEFKENEKGGGLFGVVGGALGGIGKMTAHIGLIIKIVDTSTGEILISKSVDHKKTKVGAAGGAGLFGVVAGGGFFKSKAMADAVEEAIIKTVGIIIEQKELLDDPVADSDAYRNASSEVGQGLRVTPSDCTLLNGRARPRVMVLIPSYLYSGPRSSHYEDVKRRNEGIRRSRQGHPSDMEGQNEVIRKFLEFGFDVVDQRQMDDRRIVEGFEAALEDPYLAAELAQSFNADIVITGSATTGGTKGQNLQSQRATVEARAIDAASARILATNTTYGSGADISNEIAAKKALRVAWTTMSDYMLNQLCTSMISDRVTVGGQAVTGESAIHGLTTVDINVSDLGFIAYRKLKKAIAGAAWISVQSDKYKNNTGSFTVQIEKSADELAELLIDKASVDITSFSENSITGRVQ